jgi:hypothetical protein
MTTLATIPYPMANGTRASFVSLEAKFAGQIFVGFAKLTYKRTRDIEVVYGTNKDPIGQTDGTNAYEASCEMLLAEFNALQAKLGPGYGDVFFKIDATYSQTGLDLIHDELLGCRLLSTDSDASQGTAALKRTFDLKPLKILFNGIDDNSSPLQGVPQ